MSLNLEYGHHLVRLRRRRAYAPTNNAASHENHKKIPYSVYRCGAPFGGPSGPSELRYKICLFENEIFFVKEQELLVSLLSSKIPKGCGCLP